MPVLVEPFSTSHEDDLIGVLRRVRAMEGAYPPPQDVSGTDASYRSWLLSEPPLASWVATVDGSAVGHIATTRCHDYMERFLRGRIPRGVEARRMLEVGRFFVDPLHQGAGIGTALFETALAFVHDSGSAASLAVIEGSAVARSFYRAHGLTEVGTFEGVHGTNHVFVE